MRNPTSRKGSGTRGTRLNRNNRKSRNLIEVAKVFRRDRVSEFQSGGTDEQISKRNTNTVCLALAIDLTGSQSDRCGNWMDRNSRK